MKTSLFLRIAAECIEQGLLITIPQKERPKDWPLYVALTLPPYPLSKWPVPAIERTRVLRFLLAAAVAEGEGD